MDIHSLTYFQKAAELQHITRAAGELHVAQPSLSRTITRLEEELGVRLFDRSGKNIHLNEYGKVVQRHAGQILREIEDIKAEIDELKGVENQVVTISMYACSKLLPRMIIAFKKEYPKSRLHITQDDAPTFQQKESDLLIYSSMQPGGGENEVTLIEEEIFLALPKSNPLAGRESLDLREVAEEEFICLRRGKSLRTITDTYCQMAGFEPEVMVESDSPETVRELIKEGIGVAFIPSVAWSGMNLGDISLVHISFPKCTRYIHLSWRKNGYLTPAAQEFLNFVQEYFKKVESGEIDLNWC